MLPIVAAAAQNEPGTIRGTVVDARDGSPIRQVAVRLENGASTQTTDDGRFELREVAPGPHELYVSVVDFMLVKRTVTVASSEILELTIPVAPGTGTYTEAVTVRPGTLFDSTPAAVAGQSLPSGELQQLRGLITNDPFRAVQVLPSVASGDDLRSEFTVRGFAIDHMNFTFEGVAAPFLVHTVQGIHDSGSIAMVNGDILDDITLSTGSYPERFGGRTGAELDFKVQEGSRDGTKSHVSVSFTDAAFVVEGPLGGKKATAKGSWLLSVRKSYLDRLIKRLDPTNDFAFGFTDVQAKTVYDLNPRHQLQFAMTAGRSRLDRQPDDLADLEVKDGRNSTGLGVVTWRYIASPKLILTQRLAGTTNVFRNTSRTGVEVDRGSAARVAYRLDWSFASTGRLTFDGGGEASRSNEMKKGRQPQPVVEMFEDFSAHTVAESAFVQAHTRLGSATLTVGTRIDHWHLADGVFTSPWAQVIVPIAESVRLRLGTGIYRQELGLQQTRGLRAGDDLRPEHATDFDAALDGQLSRTLRWQISAYDREDRDLIWLPNAEFKVVDGRLIRPSTSSRYQNALDGHSRGVEWLLQRRSSNGLSGWISYAVSYTKYHDRTSGETFWGDWDQRHTVNLYGSYRFTSKLSASGRFRYGSNFPAPGYWEARDGGYFVGTARNTLRVKPYSRLDLRANRTFEWQEKRLTLFIELINVYDRDNLRFASGGINGRTFEVFGLFDSMFPRIPSAGFLLEF